VNPSARKVNMPYLFLFVIYYIYYRDKLWFLFCYVSDIFLKIKDQIMKVMFHFQEESGNIYC
jgi:hypothetical protein